MSAQEHLVNEPESCDKHVVASMEMPSDAGSIPATSIRLDKKSDIFYNFKCYRKSPGIPSSLASVRGLGGKPRKPNSIQSLLIRPSLASPSGGASVVEKHNSYQFRIHRQPRLRTGLRW